MVSSSGMLPKNEFTSNIIWYNLFHIHDIFYNHIVFCCYHHWSELYFFPPNPHVHSHDIPFIKIYDLGFPVMMLSMLRFKSSVLFGTHTILDNSLRVL